MPQQRKKELGIAQEQRAPVRIPKISEDVKLAFRKMAEKHWSGVRPTANKSDVQKVLRESVAREKRQKFASDVARKAFESSPLGLSFRLGQKLGKALKKRLKKS